jgi:hypothetical protein
MSGLRNNWGSPTTRNKVVTIIVGAVFILAGIPLVRDSDVLAGFFILLGIGVILVGYERHRLGRGFFVAALVFLCIGLFVFLRKYI